MIRSVIAGARALGAAACGAALLLAGAPARAQQPPIWDGIIVPTAFLDPSCASFAEGWRASYRPKIKASDPRSSIVVWHERNTIRVEKETNGQFHGAGESTVVAVQDFDNRVFTVTGQAFNLTQTPEVVGGNTVFVELTGPMAGIMCATAIRAAFVKRTDPPAP